MSEWLKSIYGYEAGMVRGKMSKGNENKKTSFEAQTHNPYEFPNLVYDRR